MQYIKTERLRDFDFWGGAEKNAMLLGREYLDKLEDIFEGCDRMLTETEINDMMAYDFEYILETLAILEDDEDKESMAWLRKQIEELA